MIFMDCGSCVRVEVLANPLSSEDSEQDGKDVSETAAASTQKDLLHLVIFTPKHRRCKTSTSAWIFSIKTSDMQQITDLN